MERPDQLPVLPLHEGRQLFSGTQFQHRLAIGFLQILELLFVLLANIERVGAQGILHAPLRVLDPALDLGRRQVK
ncbi:hypothetical protein, partial [Rhodobacter capsulatus]|uniref:hypothetical protein n=1 Tax=Rhodobacter capsulatus TaxID=1061 RepID=UPI001F3146DF